MTMIRVTQKSTAQPGAVWALLADFSNIDFFNPNLSRSYLLSDQEEIGVGTKRQCDLKDGKNYIREEILEWHPGQSYTIDIYQGTLPINNAKTKIGVLPASNGGSLAYMEFSYTPKFGIFGKILNQLMLKHVMKITLQKVVNGLADKAERADDMTLVAA